MHTGTVKPVRCKSIASLTIFGAVAEWSGGSPTGEQSPGKHLTEVRILSAPRRLRYPVSSPGSPQNYIVIRFRLKTPKSESEGSLFGRMAEWSGGGLQILLQWFDPICDLKNGKGGIEKSTSRSAQFLDGITP